MDSLHLLMPFGSSVLVVFALLNLKKAQDRGVSSWTSMILVCWSSACIFPLLTLLGGSLEPIQHLWWQPLIMGGLFIAGQLFTFLAVDRGDVSIAAPVLGVKVLIVPACVSLFLQQALPVKIWIAAAIAVIGIAFVQARDAHVDRSRIVASVVYALLAATAMTIFDLLIQHWAPAWGAGYFLPLGFLSAALLSLCFWRLATPIRAVRHLSAGGPLLLGAILMSIQAIGMTLTLGLFGDATRVNIVYSLRGLWGVVITWLVVHRRGDQNDQTSSRTMFRRLVGAMLIGISVIIAVVDWGGSATKSSSLTHFSTTPILTVVAKP